MSTDIFNQGKTRLLAEVHVHVRDLVRLAVPIIMSRVGWMAMGTVDAIMVGHYATSELAYQSIGNSLLSVMFVPMMGLLMGTLIMTSNAYGARRYSECGRVWRKSIPYSFALGGLIALFCIFGEPLLLMTGQTPELSAAAGKVIQAYGYGMPLGLVFIVSSNFLEGIKRPLAPMVLMLLANIINIGANWLLVYGNLGFPEMGAVGSAWATTIVRVFLTVGIVVYILNMRGTRLFKVVGSFRFRFSEWREQRRLGYASGISFGVEHLSFSMLFIFAGWLGEISLSAVTIVFNMFALFFMAGSGIANGTSVRVGNAYGRMDAREMAVAGWTGLGLNTIVQLLPTVALFAVPAILASIYTNDPAVVAMAVPLFVIGSFALILDTAQTVMANALRAMHDKWYPTVSHTISYILLMIPLCWYLAFPMNRGGEGLFEGFVVASVVSVVLLVSRFWWMMRR